MTGLSSLFGDGAGRTGTGCDAHLLGAGLGGLSQAHSPTRSTRSATESTTSVGL
jgi:hypothetical protein